MPIRSTGVTSLQHRIGGLRGGATMNRRECLLSVSAATLLSASRGFPKNAEIDGTAPDADLEVQIHYGIKIPMRDGVLLDGTLYLPKNLPKPRPVIFSV